MLRRAKATVVSSAVQTDAGGKVATDSAPDEASRRVSLASRLEDLAQQGALAQAVKENRPEVDACRRILLKPLGKRTLDDIHMTGRTPLADSLPFITMLLSSPVEIVRHDDAAETNRSDSILRLALLKSGDTFGERALLSDADMRAASAIVASDTVELVFISRTVFKELLKESQEAEAGSNTLEITKRFRSNKDIIRNIFVRHSAQRSEKDLKFAVEYLKSVKFFSRFSFEVRKQLCKAMRLISAVTNTVLFEEGQIGKHFYIIFSGSVEVTVRSKDRFGETSENVVSRLGEGEYFGELALSEVDGIRRATVKCADYCELLVLSRDQYEPLIKKYQNEYHAQYAHLLRKNSYFIGPEWDDNTIEGMCSVMTEKYVPYRGEVCKQGSRASELFIVTRGECLMIHEGKHPVTNQPQLYELGRFGPNSIIGCAEASAGKFNDIFVRDYSVFAESPVKILVLSRFDIFHLMSPEARESLQRSAAGFIRESIESRALKTVAWERYRKKFLEDFIASKRKTGIGSDRGPSGLTKSTSMPVLQTESLVKKLVEPGCLLIEDHRAKIGFSNRLGARFDPSFQNNIDLKPARKLSRSDVNKSNAGPESVDDELQRRHSDSLLPSSIDEDDPSPLPDCSPSDGKANMSRRHSTSATELANPDGLSAMEEMKKILLSIADENVQPSEPPSGITPDSQNQRLPSTEAVHVRDGLESIPATRRKSIVSAQMHSTLARSQTLAMLTPSEGSLPPLRYDKPLHNPSITSGHNGRRKSTRSMKSDKLSDISSPVLKVPTVTSVTAIWNPVHGVCQPFCLLGYMKEKATPKASSSSRKPRQKHSADLRKTATSNHASDADTPNTHPSKTEEFVIAFRVFGKFRDLNETLHVFRLVCGLERTPPPDKDTGRFAVYKEDEITMVLENFFSTEPTTEAPQAEPLPTSSPYQFRAGDLLHGNGQRFACVSVIHDLPATAIENVTVHVYQCFPTLQSAVRFAKQMMASTLTASLYIVPLFDWIPVAEIDRFDAKSSDLEQALETVMDHGSSSYRSTWKARKAAVKKARTLQPRSKPKSY